MHFERNVKISQQSRNVFTAIINPAQVVLGLTPPPPPWVGLGMRDP